MNLARMLGSKGAMLREPQWVQEALALAYDVQQRHLPTDAREVYTGAQQLVLHLEQVGWTGGGGGRRDAMRAGCWGRSGVREEGRGKEGERARLGRLGGLGGRMRRPVRLMG